MTKRVRDYRAEYERRIQRGMDKGLSRSKARGHPNPREKHIAPSRRKEPDHERIRIATKAMAKGQSLTASAREANITQEKLRNYLRDSGVAKKRNGKWVLNKRRRVQMPIFSEGGAYIITLNDPKQKTRLGKYLGAVSRMLATNNIEFLAPFKGHSIIDADGKSHKLETDPNVLYALNQTHTFEEIYEPVI